VNLIPLFLCRLFGIPVSYGRLFPGPWKWCDHRGIVLDGDPGMPPTTLWFLPGFFNKAWNGILALFVWRTYTIFQVGNVFGHYHVAFRSDFGRSYSPEVAGKWSVMPQQVKTRYVAVKNGKEPCEFAIFNAEVAGQPQGFNVMVCGTKAEIEAALQAILKDEYYGPRPLGGLPDRDLRHHLTFV